MVEQALIFTLGLLVAGLIWLMFLPAFWKRAVRLTRRNIELSLPISMNEIAAERDRVRAEAAVTGARLESALAAMQDEVKVAKAEIGERLKTEAGFLARIAEGNRRIDQLTLERDQLIERVEALEAELGRTIDQRDLAHARIGGLEIQRDALEDRLERVSELAETQRIKLDELTTSLEIARTGLQNEVARSAQLRTEVQARDITIRELERRAEALENDVALARIRRGELRAVELGPPEAANAKGEAPVKAAS